MPLTPEQAAQALGMKRREVLDVRAERDGDVVTTHDRRSTLVRADGTLLALPAVAAATRASSIEVQVQAPRPRRRAPRPRRDPKPGGGEQKQMQQQEPPQRRPAVAGVAVDDVPDGDAAAVLAWVGDEADRAAVALAVEEDRAEPRDELLDALERLAG